MPKDITYIAETNFRGSNQRFGIRRVDRRQHMYVIGKTGTGKTQFLKNMALQDIENGEGIAVIDPHGEFAEEILESIPVHRMKDVVYFNPADMEYPVSFNIMEVQDPRYKHLIASGLIGIFTKIWANVWSARMEYILANCILALCDTPGTTLLGIPRMLVDRDYRQKIINNLKDPVVKSFWINEYEEWESRYRNEAIAPVQNKVGQFLNVSFVRNIVGQAKNTIDIDEIMNSGKILLVNVSKGRIGEDNSAILGAMLITKIQLSAMERVRIPENDRRDFYLYVDEFQNFATDSFKNILSEARKYRLNLVMAHQYIGQLVDEKSTAVRDAVFGNVGTEISFRVGAQDAEFLEQEFTPEFLLDDFVRLANRDIYIKLMIGGITSRPFSARTITIPPLARDDKKRNEIIRISREKYARTKQEVEDEINRWAANIEILGAAGATNLSSQQGFLRPQKQNFPKQQDQTKLYNAKCTNCGKDTKVIFEPTPGKPIYCKSCLKKMKSDQPASRQEKVQEQPEGPIVASVRQALVEEDAPGQDSALASLGIEFGPSKMSKMGNVSSDSHNKKAGQNQPVQNKNSVKQNFAQSNKPKAFVSEGRQSQQTPIVSQKAKPSLPQIEKTMPAKAESPAENLLPKMPVLPSVKPEPVKIENVDFRSSHHQKNVHQENDHRQQPHKKEINLSELRKILEESMEKKSQEDVEEAKEPKIDSQEVVKDFVLPPEQKKIEKIEPKLLENKIEPQIPILPVVQAPVIIPKIEKEEPKAEPAPIKGPSPDEELRRIIEQEKMADEARKMAEVEEYINPKKGIINPGQTVKF